MAQSPDQVTILIDVAGVPPYPPNEDVGKIWEIGINGEGYMLANNPADPAAPQWASGTVPLQPERLATSDTPFSENINRYTIYSLSEFGGGEGQLEGNRPDTDPYRFYDGVAVDPFETDSRLQLGPTETEEHDTAHATPHMALVGDTLYVAAGTAEVDYSSGGSWSTVSGLTDTTGAIPGIYDMTSDGSRWYIATGRSIIRGTTSNPGADWSATPALRVMWSAGRLLAAYKGGSSSTPNVFNAFNDSGTAEATPPLMTFPEETTVELGGTTGGVFYFGAAGSVYAWRLGVNDVGDFYTPIEAWTLPAGSTLVDVSVAADSVWVQCVEGENGDRVLYRGLANEAGTLTVFRVTDLDAGGSSASNALEYDGKVLMLWPTRRVAAVGLKRGGFAKWSGDIGTGTLFALGVWQGMPVVTDTAGKVWSLSGYATSGTVTTPVWDGASTLSKVFDEVVVACEPLVGTESIALEYSIDRGNSWSSLGTADTAGATRYVFPLTVTSESIQLRATLAGPGTTTPKLVALSVRLHPAGLVDAVIEVPIVAADEVEGLNGQIVPGSRRGRGSEIRRTLESLSGQLVRVQDIDWPFHQQDEIYEVVSAQTSAVWLQGKQEPKVQFVVTLTLRRPVE